MGSKILYSTILFCLFSSVFILSFFGLNFKGLFLWLLLVLFVFLVISKEKVDFKYSTNFRGAKLYFYFINFLISFVQADTLKSNLELSSFIDRLISKIGIPENLFFGMAFLIIFLIDFIFLLWLECLLFDPNENKKVSFFDSDSFFFHFDNDIHPSLWTSNRKFK